MGIRWLLILGMVCFGCSDDESVVAEEETNVETPGLGSPGTSAAAGIETPGTPGEGGESSGSTETTETEEESETTENEDSTEESETEAGAGGTEPEACETGTITGTFCDPGTVNEKACTSLTISGQCNGEDFVVTSPLSPGGQFELKDVPSGVHTLEVNIGHIQASCSLLIEGGQEKKVLASDCECEGEGECDLFNSNCWAEEFKDDCNCKDDDCDGEVDEDCVDICNCEDDNCNGVTDEDCVDICDGIDQNCNGVKDEDCPFVNQCLPPEPDTEFTDCDENGLIDTCPTCAAAEVVFVLDTSGSMVDELEALCTGIEAIQAALGVVNIEIEVEILGITQPSNCALDTVIDLYGNIAEEAPATVPKLADCNSESDSSEDWGTAVAIVADNKPWKTDGIKMIIPISDEAPICGNPLDSDDSHAMEAINPFVASMGVLVYPISATGTPANVIDLAKDMAEITGGIWNETTAPEEDLILHILGGVFDACGKQGGDCNSNNVPDSCDIEAGTSTDCDANGIPDSCTFDPADTAMDCDQNGTFDMCEMTDAPELDCNENGILDQCDIATTPELDCDGNGKIDSCDVLNEGVDCNGNAIPDACDIANDGGLDCDGNSVIDTCELDEEGADCNDNQVLDTCDLAQLPDQDCDGNSVIDSCELTEESDADTNGILDACQ